MMNTHMNPTIAQIEGLFDHTWQEVEGAIEQFESLAGNEDNSEALKALSWEKMADLMADYPIRSNCHTDQIQSPEYQAIANIPDPEVRRNLEFLQDAVALLANIKARIHFYSSIGAHPDAPDTAAAFHLWSLHSTNSIIARHAGDDAKMYLAFAETTAKIYDAFAQAGFKDDDCKNLCDD